MKPYQTSSKGMARVSRKYYSDTVYDGLKGGKRGRQGSGEAVSTVWVRGEEVLDEDTTAVALRPTMQTL